MNKQFSLPTLERNDLETLFTRGHTNTSLLAAKADASAGNEKRDPPPPPGHGMASSEQSSTA